MTQNLCNYGYAFLNFRHARFVQPFYEFMDGRRWQRFNSEKICKVTYARLQGQRELIRHFESSIVFKQNVRFSSRRTKTCVR